MTILQAMTTLSDLKPHQYAQANLVRWLSDLDGQIKKEVFDHYEGSPAESFTGYDETTDAGTALLVPMPYDGIYLDWMAARIDFYNAEYTKYSNAQAAFNADYLAFQAWWIRTHAHKGDNRMNY